jgi:hypothetical protein
VPVDLVTVKALAFGRIVKGRLLGKIGRIVVLLFGLVVGDEVLEPRAMCISGDGRTTETTREHERVRLDEVNHESNESSRIRGLTGLDSHRRTPPPRTRRKTDRGLLRAVIYPVSGHRKQVATSRVWPAPL